MTDYAAIARPYAKAVFGLASEQSKLTDWSEQLNALGTAITVPALADRIGDPGISSEQWAEAINSSISEQTGEAKNLVSLLAENHRLAALPEIAVQFDAFKAEAEKTLDVEVTVASDLDAKQQTKIAAALKTRFGREIRISVKQDPAVIGGAVIRADGHVIDGSVKTKLEQLATTLTH